MENSFNNLGISEPILKALDEMGFEKPTEVQSIAIPHVLDKKDLIVMAKTGSGKTAVFGVSMLQLTDPAATGPQGLILTPVRELAVQVDSDIKKMAAHLSHKTTAVYGQHSMNVELQELKKGVTIVTGTPGRVIDHIRNGNLATKNIRFLVLDEADRMLDMGFIDQVRKIIRTLPKDRVTLLFSATMPDEIKRICTEYMKDPDVIEIESQTKTVDAIEQAYYRVAHNEKRTQLNRLLLVEQPESCMIFCNTRMAVDQVQSYLTRKGYASEALHGEIPQGKRSSTIQKFKQGDFKILVATDVAARGIHIDNLGLVINYDVPLDKDSYVHRIGRTGRAGNGGRAISLVTGDDIYSLYEIEEHIGALIPEADLPSEELFDKRFAEAGTWLEANALKAKPSHSHRDGLEGDSRRGRHKGAPRKTEKSASSRSGKQQPNNLVKLSNETEKDQKKGKHNRTDKPYKKQYSHKERIDNNHKSERPVTKVTSNTGSKQNTVRKDNAVQSQNTVVSGSQGKAVHYSRTTRTGRPSQAQNPVENKVVRHSASPVADKTTTAKKKSLLQRFVQKLFGK